MSLIAVIASAVVVSAWSLVVGHAVWRLAGFAGCAWLAGPTGMATLLAIAVATAGLPGHATAVALVLLAVLGSAIAVSRRAVVAREAAEVGAVAAVGLLLTALPFIAWGRTGILGVSDNADFSAHLMLADGIAHGRDPVGLEPAWYANYPTGPHALAGALAHGLGVGLDEAFTGLLMASLALSATAVLGLVRDASAPRRLVAAVVGGLPYLGAAYMVQSAFKETLLGLFVIGWVLALGPVAGALSRRPQAVLPLGLLAAGALADYSFPALAWLGAGAAAALAAWLVAQRGLPRLAAVPRRLLATAGLFAFALALAALPQLDKAKALGSGIGAVASGTTTGGNVRAELPAYEVFGVWPSADLRAFGAGMTLLRVLALAAAGAAVWAGVWWWRRRPELPAAAVAMLAVYGGARATATPYYSAKALAVASFVVVAMTATALVLGMPPLRAAVRVRSAPGTAAATLAGTAVLVLAAWSAGLAFRGARVEPSAHRAELESLRPLLAGRPTLYMGQNDYLPWFLHDAPVAFPYAYILRSQLPLAQRPEKPWTTTDPFDFDDVTPQTLDGLRYAIEPRSAYASAAPGGWRLVRRTRSYRLWERRSPSAQRALPPGERGAPGSVLDCRTPDGAALARQKGEAGVRPGPVVVRPRALRNPDGRRLPLRRGPGFALVRPGHDAVADVALPAGRFELAAQYASPVAVTAKVEGRRLRAPASLEGLGAFWRVGVLRSHGDRVRIALEPERLPPLAAYGRMLIGSLALTPLDGGERVVPLRAACGHYVDWYRLGATP